ncbi:MAG TPA: tRNA-dihydrouridine synthase [Solirubrobacteraceae bacterium]|jgi:tRNA-dihydrouridine synthase B|nr:tRNA-dihydrouridine synthase [Solirubrobacteraceae bacterium]
MSTPQLTDPWRLGALRVPNRVLLAPLAGIGNWFVRLQAKRHGAGMTVSEMVSSHAIHYRNERTLRELLRIHPEERASGSPTSIQLFGSDPEVMRSAAATVAAAGAEAIDLNMGCPVPKVCKTGAGAALLNDPARAVALARAAVEGAAEGRAAAGTPGAIAAGAAPPDAARVDGGGSPLCGRVPGGRVPVTVKLRSGQRPGDTSGFELAQRLVADAGVAAIAFHPRSAAVHHRGTPDYALAARLAETLPAPVILTGGMNDAQGIRETFARTGATAVMLARGCLGNPWLFEELVAGRADRPTPAEVRAELEWVIDRAVEHLGAARAARYLRKFYPWYMPRLGIDRERQTSLQQSLQASADLAAARRLLASAGLPAALAV